MEFNKVDYEGMELQSKDKISVSLIGRRLNENKNSKVEISVKQVKKSTKVLSRFNKALNEDCKSI